MRRENPQHPSPWCDQLHRAPVPHLEDRLVQDEHTHTRTAAPSFPTHDLPGEEETLTDSPPQPRTKTGHLLFSAIAACLERKETTRKSRLSAGLPRETEKQLLFNRLQPMLGHLPHHLAATASPPSSHQRSACETPRAAGLRRVAHG